MEKKIRKLPIGVQSFESLRQDGYLYVDKTKYVYELVHASKQYFLSRPRRFGKSLFLSTLRAYWEGKKELFEGLDIVELEKDNSDAWQPYAVFYFDFNRDNFLRERALEEVLAAHLETWEKAYGCEDAKSSLAIRFQNLLQIASQKTGKRCVVLVDEYDKSLLETLHNTELQEHNRAVFKGFFGALKSYDEYLQFVFITGVTKFSKVSIFSDLNQLDDISMSERFSGICGITEEEMQRFQAPELEAFAKKQNITEAESLYLLRRQYDGYHFHPYGAGVFNPFSLLKALDERETRPYWFATGTPTFLAEKIKQSGFDVRRFMNKSLFASEAMLSDYRGDNPDIIPLLYQTGYLTIVDYDARKQRYTLGFPNEEVEYGFLKA